MSHQRMTRRGRVLTLAAGLGMGVSLIACAPEATLTAGGGAAPSQPGGTDGAGSAESANDTPSGESQGALYADPAACLEGEWVASNDFFLASIREFGDEIKSVEGEVVVTFDSDGTMVTDYRGWLITAVAEGVAVTIERNGTDHGKYEATETTVTIEDQQMDSVLQMSGDGFGMTVEGEPARYVDAAYTCDATTATITTPDGAIQMSRR